MASSLTSLKKDEGFVECNAKSVSVGVVYCFVVMEKNMKAKHGKAINRMILSAAHRKCHVLGAKE